MAIPLMSMLKTTRSLGLVLGKLRTGDNKVIRDGGKADNKNLSKKSKNAKSRVQTRIGATGEPIFLILDAKGAFN